VFALFWVLIAFQLELIGSRIRVFLRITQYNTDAHNTHAHSPLWIHVRKPYPYEHLRRTEQWQIWRFSKSPLAPRRWRERRLPLNRIHVYFIYAILGAARAEELSSEYDYTDDYVTYDSHTSSRPIDSETPIRHCYVVF
jgi:hypothetical protein